ncbi:hypothetical protein [uncultured Jatrophihabitans sp.]|uniref:hypothetical protein n=1 Tax=uncultured Jatrophihabitans sp. TaxID=1610747 RepID=UPI0035CA8ACC
MARNGKRLGFLPGWRIFSYVIVIFNLIMLIWVIAGSVAAQHDDSSCGSLDAKTCQDAKDVGTAIGVTALIVIWVIVDIILGILWLVTNRKTRDCPVCGHGVKRGAFQCRNCGFDFRQQYPQRQYPEGQHAEPQYAQPQYPPPQYAQPQPQPQYAQPQPQPQPQYAQPQPQPQLPASSSYYTPARQSQAQPPAPNAPEPRRRPGPGPRP